MPQRELSPWRLGRRSDHLRADRHELRTGHKLCRGRRGGGTRSRSPLLDLEALATEDGSSLSWLEGNSRLNAAIRAFRTGLGAREASRSWTGAWAQTDTRAFGFAGLTAFRVVLELFVEEKKLFAGGEDELTATVCAG